MMNSSTAHPEFTFINLTENPANGRDQRRTVVRRTVMSNYHIRRKQNTNRKFQESVLSQRAAEKHPHELSSVESTDLDFLQQTEFREVTQASLHTEYAHSQSPLEPWSAHLFHPKH